MRLSEEQRVVVEAPPEARALVIAGAGTGKTYSLIARLRYLVDEHGLAPGSELLVLSFTRNAVREVRRRLRSEGGDVAHVSGLTFDSFATRMLMTLDPEGSWKTKGYTGRIKAFASALESPVPELREILDGLRHVMIDEVQDLVTERAEMVRNLISQLECGFTVFGDPAQAIYEYQRKGQPRPAFTNWLTSHVDDLSVHTYTENYRIRDDRARVALWAGRVLARGTINSRTERRLLDTLSSLPALPTLNALASASSKATVAILCRTNGQALTISERLWEAGTHHVLQGEAASAPVEKWVSRTLQAFSSTSLTRSDFDDRLGDTGLAIEIDHDQAWRALRTLGRSGKQVDLDAVAARMRAGWVPDGLVQTRASDIVVSSVHRAKGLEFDNVIVVPGDTSFSDADDPAEEARVLYVAMTRAAVGLYRFSLERNWQLRPSKHDRWILGGTGANKWQRFGMQLLPGDVDRMSLDPAHGVDIQSRLWCEVRDGDETTLSFDSSTLAAETPRYQILHRSGPIGWTSVSFAIALRQELASPVPKWPRTITGARIACIESVAGTAAEAGRAGLGGRGFWLVPRLEGLAHFDWSARAGDTDARSNTVAIEKASSAPKHPRSSENRALWAHLKEVAASEGLAAAERELPERWAHKREELALIASTRKRSR